MKYSMSVAHQKSNNCRDSARMILKSLRNERERGEERQRERASDRVSE